MCTQQPLTSQYAEHSTLEDRELTDSVKISTEKISYAVVDNYGLTNVQLKAQQCAMISHNSACFENIATNIKSLQLIFSIVNQICSSLDP